MNFLDSKLQQAMKSDILHYRWRLVIKCTNLNETELLVCNPVSLRIVCSKFTLPPKCVSQGLFLALCFWLPVFIHVILSDD